MRLAYNMCFLLFFILLDSQVFAQQRPQIAVLDFDNAGISKDETKALTQRFRGQLVKTGAFIVLERDRMEEILKEQAFSLSGCTSAECALQVGRLLSVQKMVTGSIGRVRNTYIVDVLVFDVESGQIEKSFNRDYEGYTDGLLPILEEITLEMAMIKGISKLPLYISGMTALTALGFGTYSLIFANKAYDKYKTANTREDILKYKDDAKRLDKMTLYSGIAAGSSALFYLFYQKFYARSRSLKNFSVNIYVPNGDTIELALHTHF